MREFSWMLLVVLAFSVYAEDEKAVVVGSAKELKGITAKKIIWKKDGAVMMSIPATPFDAGKAVYDEFGDLISSVFYMDVHEVTVGQFKEFLKSSGYKPDVSIDWNRVYQYSPNDSHPMVLVTWHDATAYAKWAGKRLPTKIQLLANYPNPFNPETWIPFELASDAEVTVTIYDAVGNRIRKLELGSLQAGRYLRVGRAAYWNGRTSTGESVASGTYFYQLKADNQTESKKMIIVK